MKKDAARTPSIAMNAPATKPYDLEERTYLFAKTARAFVKRLPRTICNIEDVKQLVRSSVSVGANYIEANESLGKKDFRMHVKIARKEAKESRYWLRRIDTDDNVDLERARGVLIHESTELMNIFGHCAKDRRVNLFLILISNLFRIS